MALNDEELERYARHIVLKEIGGPGQARLRQARVLVIGAGGLGAPVLMYLAAAGIGTLGVVDDDRVSLSNLQRQIIHATPDVGVPKVESAAGEIARLNPHVTVEKHAMRLTAASPNPEPRARWGVKGTKAFWRSSGASVRPGSATVRVVAHSAIVCAAVIGRSNPCRCPETRAPPPAHRACRP